MSEKIGGYGPGGCSCSITVERFCPVHGDEALCSICKKPLGEGRRAHGPGGSISHERCAKVAKAHGIEMTDEEAKAFRRELGEAGDDPSC